MPIHTYTKATHNFSPWLIFMINPLNPELNPICYLLAFLGAHHFLHVSRIRVNKGWSVKIGNVSRYK